MQTPAVHRQPHHPRLALLIGGLCLTLALPPFVPQAVAQKVTPQKVNTKQSQPKQANHKPKPPSRSEQRRNVSATIGIDRMWRKMRADTPTGRGVIVAHVEGGRGQYAPDYEQERFDNVKTVLRSGPSKPFGHAQFVAFWLYGKQSLAPGIPEVHMFASGDWLGKEMLNAGTGEPPKLDALPRLHTHSWIGGAPGPRSDDVLRRIDYLIDQADVLMCAGVNNGRGKPVPPLLGSAYNVIAVGAVNGNSSGGYTRAEVAGRCKPDIVAPGGLTSWATPVTSAIVARLIEAADPLTPQELRETEPVTTSAAPADTQEADADDEDKPETPFEHEHADTGPRMPSEVIKAVLMAGAIKPAGWQRAAGKPLDEHLGAGMAHAERSVSILTAGRAEPDKDVSKMGWDFRAADPGSTHAYPFKVTAPWGRTSIMLVWNRRIDGRTINAIHPQTKQKIQGWVHQPRMANFDLQLVRVQPNGSEAVTQLSNSKIDNVEHVYLPELAPGSYRIQVIRRDDGLEEPYDFALAWRADKPRLKAKETLPTKPTGNFPRLKP